MEEQDLFKQIKEAAKDGVVVPSDAVWNRLSGRLDQKDERMNPPKRIFNLFSLKSLSIAASVMVLIGAYSLLNMLDDKVNNSTAIQLEDLHTLEVNPNYNIPAVGNAATIPSAHLLKPLLSSYKTIEEGDANKELIRKKPDEFGLG